LADVPEYDAFGREVGDDPLQAFRDAPTRPERVVARPEPRVAAPAPPRPRRPRRRRRRGGGLAALLVVASLGAALVMIGGVGGSVEGGLENPVEGVGPAPQATGVEGASLIAPQRFAKAVATLAGSGLGRPLSMRVAPDRIDATLVGGHRMHQVQITAGGEIRELASGDAAPGRTIPYRAIDTSAPARLVKAGATKKVPARRIDYLVISPGPPISWGAYYNGGRIVIGDAHGRKQRVL
jgi:hypothetical protein